VSPKLNLTGQPETDELLSTSPFALLVGMLLDQQFPMERAFAGPQLIAERLGVSGGHGVSGRLEPADILAVPDETFLEIAKGPPAIHRYPSAMAEKVRALAQIVENDYAGDAANIWRTARSGNEAVRRLMALPGFGEQKSKIFLALVGKQLGEGPSGLAPQCQSRT
jgi:uncharacterized HhH-GPD family protein